MQYVLSEAVTDISAYLMIHSLNAIYEDEKAQITLDKNSTFNEVSSVMKDRESITSGVALTEENIQNAVAVFNETIGRINCEPLISTAKGYKSRRYKPRCYKSQRHYKKHNKSFIKKRFKDDSLY
jgi:hypothetical protein